MSNPDMQVHVIDSLFTSNTILYYKPMCLQAEEKANLLVNAVNAHSKYTYDVRMCLCVL